VSADFRTLQTTAELEELCEEARAQRRLGLDTEFLWERTFAPQICLVQINVGGEIAIADPLEGIDVTPVARLLDDPDVQIVMHAPHADLVAFAQRHGSNPTNIFDTQIAAGFIGLSAGLSYERLVTETTGARVQPSESFTDWSKRPLSAKQLRYAGEDVEHLFAMADYITRRSDKLGRTGWALEEMDRRFGRSSRLVAGPEDAWRRVGRRGKLGSKDLGVLREIAAWRENLARRRDIPAGWVLKDPSLVELARRKPQNARELSRVRGVEGSLKGHDQQELVAAIGRGQGQEIHEEVPAQPRGIRRRVTVSKGLAAALLRARCEAEDIAAELVGTSSDVEDLVSYVAGGGADTWRGPDPALLRGWRAAFGEELMHLMEGTISLRLTDEDPFLVIERRD
jgi:ribonuclease D